MQKTASLPRDAAIPDAYILPPPWKTDRLRELPERELRAWYDNLEVGTRLGHNEILVEFKSREFKKGRRLVLLAPKVLYYPDGSSKTVGGPDLSPREDMLVKEPKKYVENLLRAETRNDGIVRADLGIMQNQYLSEAVDGLFDFMAQHGVERLGYFEEAHERLIHNAGEATGVKVTVDLDKYERKEGNQLRWEVEMDVRTAAKKGRKIYAVYHTHVRPEETHPSGSDLQEMVNHQQRSTLIITRETDGHGKNSYTVTEWRPKKGVDMEAELKKRPAKDLADYRGRALKAFLDDCFDKRHYTLREEGGGMAFQPKN